MLEERFLVFLYYCFFRGQFTYSCKFIHPDQRYCWSLEYAIIHKQILHPEAVTNCDLVQFQTNNYWEFVPTNNNGERPELSSF